MILTVAIPTYNRPDKALLTVQRLLSQLINDVKIVVFDNHSDVIVSDYLRANLVDSDFDKISVIRHKVNIGPDANFARCFELCDTEYIWLLGDDDQVETDCIETILAEIEKYGALNLAGINFKTNCCKVPRATPQTIGNTTDFVNKLDDFGSLLFLSASVFKTSAYLKHLRYAIWGAYTMASQMVPALVAISKGNTFVLSEKYIVTNIPEPDQDKGWSPVQLAMALSAILEAPIGLKGDEYKKFGLLMAAHFNCLYPLDAMFIIVRSVERDIDLVDDYHIYLFKQAILKTIEFRERKLNQLVQYLIALTLLKNKWLLKTLFKIKPKLWNRTASVAPFYLFRRS